MRSIRDGTIVALVTHAREVPAPERAAFGARVRDGLASGGVVLETCHRVEAYMVWGDGRADRAVGALPAGADVLVGADAVRHAVAVAVGRDSVVEGEDQVLHQMRATVEVSRRSGGLDPLIDRLLTVALGAGRRARSWHQGPRRSLADVALEVIEQRVGSLRGQPVLVVGAGTMGRMASRAAGARRADVAVASRTEAHARKLSESTASRWEALDPGAAAGGYVGIVVALGGPWPVGDAATRALAAAPTVIVDLSQPQAVLGGLANLLGTRLVTADALASLGPAPVTTVDGARDQVDDLIDRTATGFIDWLAARPGRDAAALLVDRAEREREAELAELWRRHPGFEPEARMAIEAMTRHLARRILRQPLERLGRDADGSGAEAARDLFAL